MFCAPRLFFGGTKGVGSLFMFCALRLVFDGTEGVGTRFHVLRARIHFRRYRGRRLPSSCFTRPDSFSTVPRASDPIFMLCEPGLIFSGVEGDGSRFHVLCSHTRFRRYRVRQVPFSYFVRSDSFSAVPRTSGPVFMLCALGLVSRGIDGIGSYFQVLRSPTHFRRFRRHRVPLSCLAIPDSFSAVPRVSAAVFMFIGPIHVFEGTECVNSRIPILRARTCFRQYRGREDLFACFARPDLFSAVPRASGPVFRFCALRLLFGSTECVRGRFHVLRSRKYFFGAECVGSRFPILHARNCFPRYRGCHIPFSSFALPHSFSAVPRALGPVFMFCAPGLIFGDTEGVGCRCHVLCSQTHFRRYRGRPVPFSCFALPDMFSAVPSASGHVFMFYAPRLIFRRYRGRRVPFSCFGIPESYSAVPRASGPIFNFYALGLVFGGTEGVRYHFHVLHSRTCFLRC
jgi:hypothetical protein